MIITTIATVTMIIRMMILLIRRMTCPPHGEEEGHDKGTSHVITVIIMI